MLRIIPFENKVVIYVKDKISLLMTAADEIESHPTMKCRFPHYPFEYSHVEKWQAPRYKDRGRDPDQLTGFFPAAAEASCKHIVFFQKIVSLFCESGGDVQPGSHRTYLLSIERKC